MDLILECYLRDEIECLSDCACIWCDKEYGTDIDSSGGDGECIDLALTECPDSLIKIQCDQGPTDAAMMFAVFLLLIIFVVSVAMVAALLRRSAAKKRERELQRQVDDDILFDSQKDNLGSFYE